MSYRMDIGALKRLREKRGLTQGQLASISGVSQASISNHERTYSDPPASIVKAYAKAFDMTVQDFMDLTYVEVPEVA